MDVLKTLPASIHFQQLPNLQSTLIIQTLCNSTKERVTGKLVSEWTAEQIDRIAY